MRFRHTFSLLIVIASIHVSLILAQAGETTVYSNNFESSIGAEWSTICIHFPCNEENDPFIATTPSGRNHLRPYQDQKIKFSLSSLPPHDSITLSFDLFIIGDWRGNQGIGGQDDLFGVEGHGSDLIKATFSNWAFVQSYPGTWGVDNFPGRTGAAENNTLGYQIENNGGDSVYKISVTFSHTLPTLALIFLGKEVHGV